MNKDQPHVDNYWSSVMVTWGFILLSTTVYLEIIFIKSEVERALLRKLILWVPMKVLKISMLVEVW